MFGIAFDVDDRGCRVFGLVAQRVNDHSAGHRAVGTGTSGFYGAGNLELPHLRMGRRNVEAECDGGSDAGGLQEPSTRDLHGVLPGSTTPCKEHAVHELNASRFSLS